MQMGHMKAFRFIIFPENGNIIQTYFLTPEDRPGAVLLQISLSIGEFGGLELDDRDGNPYGSGTYRLRIMLSPEEHTYGLYLPEIFSAYNLYIDGILIEQVGNPDPEHYVVS